MKECGRFQQDLDFILKSCKADFILIQEHHLNAVRINNVSLLLNKEWLCHCSEAFGESGIQVGVAILKRRLCDLQNHRCRGTNQRASNLHVYTLETNPDRCFQYTYMYLISQTRDQSFGDPFMTLFQMRRNG